MQFPNQYAYLYSKPKGNFSIRQQPTDFQVQEQLSFTPDAQGEHLFLYIRKTGENTDWVARQLARFCQIKPMDVGYAGKKDRHAITEQWFSVRLPVQRTFNWNLFSNDTIQVLKTVRHSRKLRLGALKSNKFKLRLTNISDITELQQRFELVQQGVPNYFGQQRFGRDNLGRGLALLRGEYKERQRNKKTMYISALRSWCFNHLVSARIEQQLWQSALLGDAFMLDGSKSTFVAEQIDTELEQRLAQKEIHLTSALWGAGDSLNVEDSRAWEQAELAPWQELLGYLEALGLKQERRALRLLPKNIELDVEDEHIAWISFELPTGTYATSVLRELGEVCNAQQN